MNVECSQALNVLQIYYEPAPAGQTKHVIALTQALAHRGHHVTTVLPHCLLSAPEHTTIHETEFEHDNVRLVPLSMRKLIWPPKSLLALAHLIRQGNWHIVHVHSLEAGLCGRTVSWLAGAPHRSRTHLVYTPQTIDIRRTRWHGLYKLIERLLSTVTEATISVNEADRQRLIRWGLSPRQVVTIPNGIELEAPENDPDPSSARQSLGLAPDRPLVIQVARLSAQKDPLAFVEGAALVIQQRPDAQFAMIGQGPLRETLASRIQTLGIKEHVHLLGWRDNARRLMTAADVITLTSRWEGSPYSLLEAMAASRANGSFVAPAKDRPRLPRAPDAMPPRRPFECANWDPSPSCRQYGVSLDRLDSQINMLQRSSTKVQPPDQ